ncbi:DUF2339 domain-containing protein [Paenibacillus antarcticus]|uniref:DUF2339 domain-containing protein n=1 Tax=Paenibacillus antarcticus TaxID=253703 RepID=A0A162MCW5_9BACL|nr:DUF2339 domain-containing protein [Paenibacillus antarcticus]OAB47265.1 hypothetical protein PBAT_06040 [Paenibacillus antarcticus]
MKEFKDRLFHIQNSQNQLSKEVQTLIHEYESYDVIHENEILQEQHKEQKIRLTTLQKKVSLLEEENMKLRTSLTEQIMNEKLNIINVSREKLNTYFASRSDGQTNQLRAFELQTKSAVQRLFERSSNYLKEEKEEMALKLAEISDELNQKIMIHRERIVEDERRLHQQVTSGLDRLATEEVTEEVMQKRIKQNQFEMKVGLNWLNKVAMLLIILAVGVSFKYMYTGWFNGYMKGSAFFLLGIIMLVGGEWLFRKQKQTFALGLLGGGISILYGSIFYSYFLLDIIDIYVGLTLSVLVSLTAVLLSLRYHSRSIISLGLVGGYLPLFSYMGAFGLEGNAVYVAMGYLFLLNASILLVSFRKRWVIVNYISFLFNVPSMIALVSLSNSNYISMVYVAITFMLYLGMTLGYPFKYKSKLSWWDFTLLALNTFTSCVTLYVLFHVSQLEDFQGLLALVFCLVYIRLGRFLEKFMHQERQTTLLFYATSLTFAILMIPFQFGAAWVSIGWLAEGVLLTIYGSLNRFKSLEKAGWGILTLCLGAFLWGDMLTNLFLLFHNDPYYTLKYSFVTGGMLLVTLYYAVQQRKRVAGLFSRPYEAQLVKVFKYVSLLNVWFYFMYELRDVYDTWVPNDFSHFDFYSSLLMASITIGLAYGLSKVKVLYDRVVKYYVMFLYGVGYLLCIMVTLTAPALQSDYTYNTATEYIALGILVGFNVLVFFSIREVLIAVIRQQYKSIEIYPVALGVYLLGILTSFLVVQFQLEEIGLIFSLLYLLLAIVYIAFGFRYRYVYIRRFGLGLTLAATGKLILYDLSLLSTGSTIIAYFTFGIVLLGISYGYQKVSSRLGETHANEGVEADSKS